MNRSETRDLALVLAVAFLASLAGCLTKGRTIEGDDAIMGFMALKISRGEEFPAFFWQAHESGPKASCLAAPLHRFFEPSPLVIRSVIVPIHLTDEKLIYTPAFQEPQYDRCSAYTVLLSKQIYPAFVFLNTLASKDFRAQLERLSIVPQEERWDGFIIFHQLSGYVDIRLFQDR